MKTNNPKSNLHDALPHVWSTLGPVPAVTVLPLFLLHWYTPTLVSFQPHKPDSKLQGPTNKNVINTWRLDKITKKSLNTWSPSIKMDIHLTILHLFLMVPLGRFCLNIKIFYSLLCRCLGSSCIPVPRTWGEGVELEILPLLIIVFFLMASMFCQVMMLLFFS